MFNVHTSQLALFTSVVDMPLLCNVMSENLITQLNILEYSTSLMFNS